MNELQEFETELASLKPARLPEDFATELSRKLIDEQRDESTLPHSRKTIVFLPVWIRWAMPVAAAAALALAVLPLYRADNARSKTSRNAAVAETPIIAGKASVPSASVLKPDAILISQELVGNFDAVAHSPDGAPIRLRCQEWVDEVQLRDPSRGVWVERRKPRLEIVRVGYEIY